MCQMGSLSFKSTLAPLPLFGTLCQLLVILSKFEPFLLGCSISNSFGVNARFLGALAPILRVSN